MAKTDALTRLGGGRWETKDGRFQIEPQSGTWVIVDTTQTNEFGLPLVRGPFPSLTAAKEAIETAREQGRSNRHWRTGSARRAAAPAAKPSKPTTTKAKAGAKSVRSPSREPSRRRTATATGAEVDPRPPTRSTDARRPS